MGGRTQGELRVRGAREKYAKWRDRDVQSQQSPVTIPAAAGFLLLDSIAGRDPSDVSLGGGATPVGVLGALLPDDLRNEDLGLGMWVRNRVIWRNRALAEPGRSGEDVAPLSYVVLDTMRTIAQGDHADQVAKDLGRRPHWYGGRPPTATLQSSGRRDIGFLPTTVDDALQWLLREVPRQSLVNLGALDEGELGETHFGLALHIRNKAMDQSENWFRQPAHSSPMVLQRPWSGPFGLRFDPTPPWRTTSSVPMRNKPRLSVQIARLCARDPRSMAKPARTPDPSQGAQVSASPALSDTSDVDAAVVLAARVEMQLSPQLEVEVGMSIDERGNLKSYKQLISLYELRTAANDVDGDEDELTSEADRLHRAFDWIVDQEPPNESAGIQGFVDSQGRERGLLTS